MGLPRATSLRTSGDSLPRERRLGDAPAPGAICACTPDLEVGAPAVGTAVAEFAAAAPPGEDPHPGSTAPSASAAAKIAPVAVARRHCIQQR